MEGVELIVRFITENRDNQERILNMCTILAFLVSFFGMVIIGMIVVFFGYTRKEIEEIKHNMGHSKRNRYFQ